jgi:ribosome maturation factor RimP
MQNLDEILRLADIEAEPMGLLVVDARFTQQGRNRVLEVSICRKGGRISLDDCEALSRKLDQVLDEHEPPVIEGSYMLEVQSPGLDRQLKTPREYEIFAGEMVEVKAKESFPGLGDHFIAKLESLTDGVVSLAAPKKIEVENKQKKKPKAKASAQEPPENILLDLKRITQLRLYPVEPAEILQEEENEPELSV